MELERRINVLDGFRFLAILPVLFFHFYARWTKPIFSDNYYPYASAYSVYFKYGSMGVAFFFIISGFVIFYTLETSHSFKEFLIKRIIRLLPTMLLCSLITYFLIPFLDPTGTFPEFHSKTVLNFLPSLTFTNPYFWNKLFGVSHIDYISGSYWSLWVEASFYILAGGIFFFDRKNFISNWLYIVLSILIITKGATILLHKIVLYPTINDTLIIPLRIIKRLSYIFQLHDSGYNLYFSLGIIFFCLYKGKKLTFINYAIVSFMFLFYTIQLQAAEILVIFFMVFLFLIFIYNNKALSFLDIKIISHIGVISYSLYLTHEGIGVIIINKLSSYLSSQYLIILTPILVVFLLIIFSSLLYRFYEKPVIRFLKNRLVQL